MDATRDMNEGDAMQVLERMRESVEIQFAAATARFRHPSWKDLGERQQVGHMRLLQQLEDELTALDMALSALQRSGR